MPDEPIPDTPGDEPTPAPDHPVYTAPTVEPPPNVGAYPSRGERGGDGG